MTFQPGQCRKNLDLFGLNSYIHNTVTYFQNNTKTPRERNEQILENAHFGSRNQTWHSCEILPFLAVILCLFRLYFLASISDGLFQFQDNKVS